MRHETKNTEYHKTTENTGSTVNDSKQNAVPEIGKNEISDRILKRKKSLDILYHELHAIKLIRICRITIKLNQI